MYKILLLEDDISLIDGLEYSLQKNNFAVETVRTVGDAQKCLCSPDLIRQYDLLLLDVTLPDGTGFEVCEQVREANSRIPIVFLTASDEEVNVIRGLDGGGDDYITKPFKIGELCSRIRALLRRAGLNTQAEADNCRHNQCPMRIPLPCSEPLISVWFVVGQGYSGQLLERNYLLTGPSNFRHFFIQINLIPDPAI